MWSAIEDPDVFTSRPLLSSRFKIRAGKCCFMLYVGPDVRILDNQTGKWKPAAITSRCEEPRSYILHLPDGSSKRRNRVQIRAAETSSYKQVIFNDHITSLKKDSQIQTMFHTRTV